MPFTLVHAGKYKTEDKLKIQTKHKLNTTQKKQTIQNTAKQNYPGLVTSYDIWPGNEVGIFYNAPKPSGPLQAQNSKVTPHISTAELWVHGPPITHYNMFGLRTIWSQTGRSNRAIELTRS